MPEQQIHKSFTTTREHKNCLKIEILFIIIHIFNIFALFKMRGGAKISPTSFSPVTSTNVGVNL